MVRIFSIIDKETAPLITELGSECKVEALKSRKLLGWNLIPNERAILDYAKSLYQYGALN
nr:hypothetical protein [uncultured Allomuricauda sp.]